jgi:site-specific DNA-methyltransferase (adenine-specific)
VLFDAALPGVSQLFVRWTGIDAPDKLRAVKQAMEYLCSSKDMTWATPQEWFAYLDLEFDFTLDPCCQHETAKCKKHYTPEEDGLAQSWQDERVFMNPPYGRELPKWMAKAYTEARDNGALVVCFVPARVDTEWWHRYAAKAAEIRYPKGRVTFAGATHGAPFPVAIIIFRPRL